MGASTTPHVTESTNDIGNFEGVAIWIDVALRRLIDRVEADLAGRATPHPNNVTEDTSRGACANQGPEGILIPTEQPKRPGRKEKMSTTIHRTEDPTLETIELGAIYRVHVPRTGDPWTLYTTGDDCGIDSIEPLEVPDGWDDSHEYAMSDEPIWPRLARRAMDAYLAHTILEVAVVPVVERMKTDSRALLYRFS